jgi:hypothetical protein
MENLYRWCDYASSPRCRRQAMEAFLAAESRKRQQQVHLSTTESIVLGERSGVVYANTYTTQPRAAGGGGRGGGRSPARPAQPSGPSRGVYTALAFYLEHLLSSAFLYARGVLNREKRRFPARTVAIRWRPSRAGVSLCGPSPGG